MDVSQYIFHKLWKNYARFDCEIIAQLSLALRANWRVYVDDET